MRATASFVLGISCVWNAGIGQDALPRYFPLDAGSVWSFGISEETPARWEIIVLERTGDVALVRYQLLDPAYIYYGPWDFRLRERGLEIDIELGDEGFVPFYRFDGAAFTHRDFRSCEDGLTMVSFPVEEPVQTPAGVFGGCLATVYHEVTCSDFSKYIEVFCPDIGLVSWSSPDVFLMERAPMDKPFLRGDANMDGSVNIADPLNTFSVLFLGEGFFYCADAADANDDGDVNVSDAIFTLSFLFLGEQTPPDPGPEGCGFDPTDDETKCGSSEPCLRRLR
jgi:hypothetical protein